MPQKKREAATFPEDLQAKLSRHLLHTVSSLNIRGLLLGGASLSSSGFSTALHRDLENNTFVLLCPVMPASFSTCLQFIPWFMCFFFYYAELLLHFNVLSVEPLYEVLIKEPLSQLVHNVSMLQQSTGGSQSISQSCCLDEAFDSVKIIGHSIYVNFLSLQNSLTDYFLYFYDCLRTRLRQTSQRWPCSVF